MHSTFEHKADIGIRGTGKTLAEAFEETAKAMFGIMWSLENVKPKQEIKIHCTADDNEALLIEWLNALLAEADVNEMVFSEFHAKVDGKKLSGKAIGEKRDLAKHYPKTEVKAATYSSLKVRQNDGGTWVAQCVVDV